MARRQWLPPLLREREKAEVRGRGHGDSPRARAMKRPWSDAGEAAWEEEDVEVEVDEEQEEVEVEEEQEEQWAPAVGPSSWIGHGRLTLVPRVRAKGAAAMAIASPKTPPKSMPSSSKAMPAKVLPAKAMPGRAGPAKAIPAGRAQGSSGGGASLQVAHGPTTTTLVMGLPALVPTGTDAKSVSIWPTGIMMLNSVRPLYEAHVKSKARGRYYPSRPAILSDFRDLLTMNEQEIMDASHMIVVDARGPSSAKPAQEDMRFGHVGTHPEIMQQVLASEEFVIDIGRQLRDQWPKDPDTMAIGVLVFCKSGKHRSVAWSNLIQTLLLSYGYDCRVSQTAMNFTGTCGQRCGACTMDTPLSIMAQAIVKLSLVDAA